MTSAVARPPADQPGREGSTWSAGLLVAGGALIFGLAAGELVAAGHSMALLGLSVVLLPVLLWKRPDLGPTVLLVSALMVEQFGYTVGALAGAATEKIPLFHGLGSLHINPADLLLVLLFGIYVAKRDTRVSLNRSPLRTAMLSLVAVVALGVVVGATHGGQLRMAMTESRPYVYLAATYLLASLLLRTRESIRALLWGLVAGVGFKAAQGLLIFMQIRHLSSRPDAVLAHEEALFFAIFLLFVLALWLFDVPGRLRTTATALAPVVVAADLANTRRAAWLVLGVGLIALLIVAYAALPSRRRVVFRIMIAIALASAVYLPAYWNKSGGLAQPARAIHSSISPSPRDAASDLYRIQEDANLKLNISRAGPLGMGFGVPIDYALPIEDISDIDPFIAYIPHNGVLYILMRMGVLGAVVFWTLLGLAIVAGCRLAKSRDGELAVIGALSVSVLLAYTFEGSTDQGFFFYRIAFVVGTLLGLAEAATRLSPRVAATAPVDALAPPATALRRPRRAPAPPLARRPPARPAAGPARRERTGRRRDRDAQLTALVLLPLAVGFFVWLLTNGGSERTTTRFVPAPVAIVTPTTAADPALAPAKPAVASTIARVVLTGATRGSWVEVRRDSALGPVLYQGVLADGSKRSFQARRLWIRFGAAANVEVTANGRPVSLQGTREAVFTSRGVSSP